MVKSNAIIKQASQFLKHQIEKTSDECLLERMLDGQPRNHHMVRNEDGDAIMTPPTHSTPVKGLDLKKSYCNFALAAIQVMSRKVNRTAFDKK